MEQAAYEELSIESKPEIEDLFAEIRKEFEGRAEELIPMLQRVQGALGFLPEEALIEIARLSGLSAARVFGIATFYSQFRLQPAGKYMIRVCRGTACHVKGAAGIAEAIEKSLGVGDGQTTEDMRFTFETVACLGTCFLAPVMMVNNDYYGHLDANSISEILDKYN